MSLIHWVYLAKSTKKYVLYLTPDQITNQIKQRYPNSTISENIIKI
jgi:hypothetical protein